MKRALVKDSVKQIKNTLKRFISILMMAFLGVGFFAGIKATSPDMIDTIDRYYKEQNIYDLEIVSTLGLTNDDLNEIAKIDGIDQVEGTYEKDAIIENDNEEIVVKLLCANNINVPVVLEGNLPINEDECVVEDSFLKTKNKKIGDYIDLKVEDSTNDNGDKKVGLGIWIDTTDIMYINTNVKDSLSTGSCPMDTEHFPASYSAQYLCNSIAEANTNLLNNKDIIEENLIAKGVSSVDTINKDLEDIHKAIDGQPHQFESNTVTYNPVYTPSAAAAEDVVPPFGVRANNGDKFIGIDSVNKVVTVPKAGIYQLQLKNGFYLIQGESRVDVRVYINDNEIKEMGISLYLTSNADGIENPSKAIKNIFSSNSYMTRLSTTDKIKVTATWMNIDNIQIENETMLTVTAMQFNLK